MFNILNLFAIEPTQIVIWVIIAILLIVIFVLPMFTNRKRQKEVNEMYEGVQIGDEIMTIGGVMGKVVSLTTHESGEKLMTIETGEGDNKTTMTFTVQAMRLNYTKTKLRQEQLAKARAEKESKNAIPLAPDDTDNAAEEVQDVREAVNDEVPEAKGDNDIDDAQNVENENK